MIELKCIVCHKGQVMKKAICVLMLMSALPAFAADWTPAFAYLEQGKKGDGGKTLDAIMANVFKERVADIYHPKFKQHSKEPLTAAAKSGKYTAVPTPYRHDMLPAKVVKTEDIYLQATVPLKNATLYGQPLQSITYDYGCANCGDVGFYATFKPMSNQAYQKLIKSVKFKTLDDDDCNAGEPAAGFYKEDKEAVLYLTMGC